MAISLSNFKVPSKTFIWGEYLALNGGSTLIFNSRPYFEMKISYGFRRAKNDLSGPAHFWLEDHSYHFDNGQSDFIFTDPHHGSGGFGSSTAQFAVVWSAPYYTLKPDQLHVMKALDEYKRVTHQRDGFSPSGADIVGQIVGGFCHWNAEKHILEKLKWPFKDYTFKVCRIKHEAQLSREPTHEHLKKLKDIDTQQLSKIADQLYRSWKKGHTGKFLTGINDYHHALLDLNVVHESSRKILAAIKTHPLIHAGKTCGAQGFDTLIVFYKKEDQEAVEQILRENKNIQIVAGLEDISEIGVVEVFHDGAINAFPEFVQRTGLQAFWQKLLMKLYSVGFQKPKISPID